MQLTKKEVVEKNFYFSNEQETEQTQQCRIEFEKWAKRQKTRKRISPANWNLELNGKGNYKDSITMYAWKGWLAAWNAKTILVSDRVGN